jgi:HEAT repeat protein
VGHLGDVRVSDDIGSFLKASPLLQVAAVYALRELRSPSAVSLLSAVLQDNMIGPMAAEAIACIGGLSAFKVLVKHWLKFRREIDTENYLGLLRYVAEGIPEKPLNAPGFRESVLPYLDDPNSAIRTSAACCLLAAGPCADDERALSIVSEAFSGSRTLPACLRYRADLVPGLLKARGFMQSWGFQLAARFPKSSNVQLLSDAINSCGRDCEYISHIAEALLKIKNPALACAVLDLYLRISWNMRPLLHTVIRAYKKQIRSLLIDCDTDDETRLVISSITGTSPVCIALEILDLPLDSRILVISQLSGQKSIMKCLPWTQWFDNNPGFYITVAAEVAVRTHFPGLLPVLRKALAKYPIASIINAVGRLADRESAPVLISHLSSVSLQTKALIIECLGRIGGTEAKKALKRLALSNVTEESIPAFCALAACSSDQDCELFRDAATNPDWHIRLMCVDVLSRFPSAKNFSVLTKLSVDPVPVVAQRAFYFLKYLPMSNFLPLESGEMTAGAEDRRGISLPDILP